MNKEIKPVFDGTAIWRREQRRLIIMRVIRLCTGIPLLLFSFPIPWFGPFLMLLGAIIIARDLVDLTCYIFGDMFTPRHKGKPVPMYGIPESLAAKGKYIEAEMEYEKIIQEYPQEIKPHIDMINIAVVRLKNGELAKKLYERGMELIEDPDSRANLTKMYDSISSRLK